MAQGMLSALRLPTETKGIPVCTELLDGTGNVGKHVVGVRADEANRAHDDDQNDGKHHRVFGDVLTGLIPPEIV
jgi:hypothetical protein